MTAALVAAATLLATAFALATYDRWDRRRQPHEAAWTVSLVMFALGSAAMWWAETQHWSLSSFRLFFLAGAVLNVPWLALGTVYLLGGRRAGDVTRIWLIALSGLSTGIVLFAPAHAEHATGIDMPAGSDVFGAAPRVLAAVGSGVAAIVIIGGALWSVVQMWRGKLGSRIPPERQRRMSVGNVFIALGTLILSASGALSGRVGRDRSFALTLATGIAVLFVGFLVSSASPRRAPLRSVELPPQDLSRQVAR